MNVALAASLLGALAMAQSKILSLPLEYKEISNFQFGWRTALWMGLVCAGFYLALTEAAYIAAIGVVILGISIGHGVELSHQALHNTGFTSKRANEIFGILMGLPLLVSFYEYRITHLAHHKHVGTTNDTEFFDYGEGRLTVLRFLGVLSMWRHYARVIQNIFLFLAGKPIPGFRSKDQRVIKRFYLFVIVFLVVLGALGIFSGTGIRPYLVWMIAVMFVAGPIHALIEFPEHYQCDTDTKDTLRNSRTLRSNRFMHWFTNCNNFHAEHHMHPTIPLHNAKHVYETLQKQHGHHNRGYRDFYRDIIQDLAIK